TELGEGYKVGVARWRVIYRACRRRETADAEKRCVDLDVGAARRCKSIARAERIGRTLRRGVASGVHEVVANVEVDLWTRRYHIDAALPDSAPHSSRPQEPLFAMELQIGDRDVRQTLVECRPASTAVGGAEQTHVAADINSLRICRVNADRVDRIVGVQDLDGRCEIDIQLGLIERGPSAGATDNVSEPDAARRKIAGADIVALG